MAPACQVDFYVLQNERGSPQKLACQLAMMAWQQGHGIVVLTEDEQAAASLDELMWSHPDGRFLPHGRDGKAPVRISTPASLQSADQGIEGQVVINLTTQAIETPADCRRLLEIVPPADADRLASRQKYRVYRDQGLEPRTHKME